MNFFLSAFFASELLLLVSSQKTSQQQMPSGQQREPFCRDGTVYETDLFTWTNDQLESQIVEAKESDTVPDELWTDPYVTEGDGAYNDMLLTIKWFCEDNFTLEGLAAKGISAYVGPAPSVGQHSESLTFPPTAIDYAHANGIRLRCVMCDFYPHKEDVAIEPIKKGMTWTKKATDDIGGSITVGCHGFGTACDPYNGDTSCDEERPLLCFHPLGAPKPVWIVESMWYKWTGGVVATTPPVSPATAGLSTLASADNHCEATFGSGWRVAEFHEGSGWNFHAFGGVGGVEADRFWVHIDDQVNGNCWSF